MPDRDDTTAPITPEDLMGTWEVAEYLGWARNLVGSYASTGAAGMPAPFVRLRSGRIWLRQDIEEWARVRGYKAKEVAEGDADVSRADTCRP